MATRSRRENFSSKEKTLIVEFVYEHRHIMESKDSSIKLQNKKQEKWMELSKSVEAMGTKRNWKDIRGAYQRWKLAAKKSISTHRKSMNGTGLASPEPSVLDFFIRRICPEDFGENKDCYNSDSIKRAKRTAKAEPWQEVTYEVYPAIGELTVVKPKSSEPTPGTSTQYCYPSCEDEISVESEEETPLKKKQMSMTSYEEAMLELETKKANLYMKHLAEKHKIEIELMKKEHELKIKILAKQLEKEKLLIEEM